jgi:hypothetical protein
MGAAAPKLTPPWHQKQKMSCLCKPLNFLRLKLMSTTASDEAMHMHVRSNEHKEADLNWLLWASIADLKMMTYKHLLCKPQTSTATVNCLTMPALASHHARGATKYS